MLRAIKINKYISEFITSKKKIAELEQKIKLVQTQKEQLELSNMKLSAKYTAMALSYNQLLTDH